MDVISGNRVLKESRDNRGQKAGHVGMPTFVGKYRSGGGRKLGRSSLDNKPTVQGCGRGVGRSSQAPGQRAHDYRRPVNWLVGGDEEGDSAGTRLLGGVRRVRMSEDDDEAASGRSEWIRALETFLRSDGHGFAHQASHVPAATRLCCRKSWKKNKLGEA